MFRSVVVFNEINRLFFEVSQQRMRQLGHANFGVSHRCRRITIDRAKITLTVNERIAQRERLRHSHNRIVNRRVTVRMVFTDNVTDDTSGLFVCLIPVVVELIHRKQNAAVYRL